MILYLRILCLAAACQIFMAASLHAMPPRQHRVEGTIQIFDPPTQILSITPTRATLLSSFLIKEGRTRLRENGKRVSIHQLPATGAVVIYYRTEFGQRVATEVSWRVERSKP